VDIPQPYELERRRRELTLPLSAYRLLKRALEELHSVSGTRLWALRETTIPQEVAFYGAAHQARKLPGPVPVLKSVISSSDGEETALRLAAAFEFLEMSRRSSPEVAPVLLHYAAAHATGVYSRAFLDWRADSRKHGIAVTHNSDTAATEICIQKKGHFPRLAAATFLLTGSPSYFSELVTYAGPPIDHAAPGQPLERFQAIQVGPLSPRRFTLAELLSLDLRERGEFVKAQFGLWKWRSLPAQLLLYDLLVIMVASNIARYDVLGWRTILDGKHNDLRLRFDACFQRFRGQAFDYLLLGLASPAPFSEQRARLPSWAYCDSQAAEAML
jgi:hypothetical protein